MSSNKYKYKPWNEAAVHYTRDFAYKNGDYIYYWMDKNGIGKTAYGAYLDSLGRKPGVFYHRLYGHHPIYDFPITEPKYIPDFLEHILISDFFTKQGLPIIPGKIIESTQFKSLFDQVGLRWNFINGFDLMVGTLAVYNNYKISSKFFQQEATIEKIDELAMMLGITGIHVAIALSTFNPLLLISSTISAAGTMFGVLNNPYKVYFNQIAGKYVVTVAIESYDIEQVTEAYSIGIRVNSYDINSRDYI